MSAHWRAFIVAVSLFLAVPIPAQEVKTERASAPTQRLYADSEKGLRHLMADLLDAARKGERLRLRELAGALTIPQASNWFRENFGIDRGALLADEYESFGGMLPLQVVETLVAAAQENLNRVEVRRFDNPCDPFANENQYPILAARQTRIPLYEVQVTRGNRGMVLWFFAYVDGGFRYTGNIRFRLPRPPGAVEVRAEVQQARLIHSVRPNYSVQARRARLQGTVLLTAIVGVGGTIQDLQLVQGHCWLAQPALEAVQKWRYTATLVDGQPVAVLTTIEVIFTLEN